MSKDAVRGMRRRQLAALLLTLTIAVVKTGDLASHGLCDPSTLALTTEVGDTGILSKQQEVAWHQVLRF